jgi:transposase-like protein
MADDVLTILSRITTVSDMTQAFSDEDQCRRLLEAMVWPRGRICPACGYKRSTSIPGRDWGKTKRPGRYQCSNSACHHQFTVTTRTPLHSTKLPLRLWLQGLWLILQSDKGLSSVRLGEALGISQQASWRMGHALRLLMTNEKPLEGTVEIDELRIGGTPHKPAGNLGPGPGRGRRGQPRTTKTPVLALVQRPEDRDVGTQAGSVRAAVVDDASAAETARVMSDAVAPDIHLMSDEWSNSWRWEVTLPPMIRSSTDQERPRSRPDPMGPHRPSSPIHHPVCIGGRKAVAQNQGGFHLDQINGCGLWVIKARYDFAQFLFRPHIRTCDRSGSRGRKTPWRV